MSQIRPDLDTARRLLEKAKRRRKILRCLGATMLVLACGTIIVYILLQTRLFADVYRQLVEDLGLV